MSFLTTTWVEGIGGLSYINTPAVGPELYGFGELSCFAFNDTDFVYKSIFSKEKSDCNINFVVKEEDTLRIIENEKSRVKVFPKSRTKYNFFRWVVRPSGTCYHSG